MSHDNSILTQEELAFISEMEFEQTYPTVSNSDLSIELMSDDRSERLLERLGLASKLKLSAQFDSHKLVFPVSLNKSDFGQFNIKLKAPEIFELGSQPRNWRHQLEKPIKAICTQAKRRFELNEISSTGFCLDLDRDAPDSLELEIILPDCGSEIRLTANKVRMLDNKAAYEMVLTKERRERLRRFLFNKHRLTHQTR